MISLYVDSKVKFGMPMSVIQHKGGGANRGTRGFLVTDDAHEIFSNPWK